VEALAALRRGHELGSAKSGWGLPSEKWVRETERLVRLEERLPDLLENGTQVKQFEEALALAKMCLLHKKLYAAAAGFYADAFDSADAPEPVPPKDVYDAARAAALAGRRMGADAASLGKGKCSRLREQALDWLRANLAVLKQVVEDGTGELVTAAREALARPLEDPDLLGVRHPWSLLRLPADERKAWQKLWADTEALLNAAKKPSSTDTGKDKTK
jgi:hypothetical protein